MTTELNDMKEFFSMIGGIGANVKNLKPVLDIVKTTSGVVSKGIVFSSAKKKEAIALQDNLVDLENKFTELQNKMDSFENKANNVLPKMAQLIRSYSEIVSLVNEAKAKADKTSEIVGFVPELAKIYALILKGTEDEYNRIASNMEKLPPLDNAEMGIINTHLKMIRNLINDLKNYSQESDRVLKINGEISYNYGEILRPLSRLLNKILDNFKIL